MKTSEWLPFYAGRFATVEINNTFYRMPEKETLETWRDAVPPEFVFSLKASRYITHMKKLKDVSQKSHCRFCVHPASRARRPLQRRL
jgi:uncharacterized protein YecE (DUF72 family)